MITVYDIDMNKIGTADSRFVYNNKHNKLYWWDRYDTEREVYAILDRGCIKIGIYRAASETHTKTRCMVIDFKD